MEKRKIITGLDLETTGLEQERGHRIIEVAAIMYDAETEQRIGSFVRRINPQRSIDPGAQAVHHISFEDVSGCPTWEEIAPSLCVVMGRSDLIVAHNGDGFDMPFIGRELLRIGHPIPDVQAFDTMKQFRHATPMGKHPSLKELCFACGIEYDEDLAHAAEYDTSVMMQCFFHMRRKGFVLLGEL